MNSDTELVLADNVAVTLNNTQYQIQVTVPDSASDAVWHIVANTTYITQFLQNMDKWMSQSGVVDVTLPNGQTVSLQAAMLDKNKKGADIPNKSEFVKNLGLQGTAELEKNAIQTGQYGLGGIAPIASDNDLNAKRLPTSFYRMGGGTGGRDGEQVFCCGMMKILYFIFG
ncbi:hypothetical protein [Xenorhabdus griffiniae]|nr:hypothetical protein [Xenorhabdus griffiniae]MBD1229304.1 hypothetical protein [Xenorhabdus griffiniae]